jgi:hypothetical protein
MVMCPKCGKPIPAWKLIFLTNFNTITCPTCSAKLRANKRINKLIGGIGGGVGGGLAGLLVILWFDAKEVVYLVLLIALFPFLFSASWLAMIKFTKLEALE